MTDKIEGLSVSQTPVEISGSLGRSRMTEQDRRLYGRIGELEKRQKEIADSAAYYRDRVARLERLLEMTVRPPTMTDERWGSLLRAADKMSGASEPRTDTTPTCVDTERDPYNEIDPALLPGWRWWKQETELWKKMNLFVPFPGPSMWRP